MKRPKTSPKKRTMTNNTATESNMGYGYKTIKITSNPRIKLPSITL